MFCYDVFSRAFCSIYNSEQNSAIMVIKLEMIYLWLFINCSMMKKKSEKILRRYKAQVCHTRLESICRFVMSIF